MTVYRTCICVFVLFICATSQAHAFWESIKNKVTLLSVRNQRIQHGICNVLSDKSHRWWIPDPPTHKGEYLKFCFYPYDQETSRHNQEFIFAEIDFNNYPGKGFSSADEVMEVPCDWYSFNTIPEDLRKLSYLKKTEQEIIFEIIYEERGSNTKIPPLHVLGRIYRINPKKYQLYFFKTYGEKLTKERKEHWLQKIYRASINI